MTRSLRMQLLAGAATWSAGAIAGAFGLALTLLREHLVRDGHQQHPELLADAVIVSFAIAAAVLLAIGAIVMWRALRPLARLRDALADVRSGAEPRLAGAYPSEIQPVVDDLNSVLARNTEIVERARALSGSLAHGLRTPLAILANDVAALRESGVPAERLEQQIAAIHQYVAFHLTRSRAGTHGARCDVAAALQRLVRTIRVVHAERELEIDVDAPPGLLFRGESADFDEIAGNLLENAAKWARRRVVVTAARDDNARVRIDVDDDGPGIAAKDRERVFAWGERLDPAVSGTGLGLPIVRELAKVYGGGVRLTDSPLGGTRATAVF